MTYTLVAWDANTRQYGIASQSHFFATGRTVPWLRQGVGAVATQGFSNAAFGPAGLNLAERGLSASEIVKGLLAEDSARETRQLAVIDSHGLAAVHTGSRCLATAGHLVDDGVVALGNILAHRDVLSAMLGAYQSGEGDLAHRLLAGLDSAQAAGGDLRGQQSAALMVSQSPHGGEHQTLGAIDVRVDDHPRPLEEIRRLVGLDRWYAEFSFLANQPGLLTGPVTSDKALVERALIHLEAGEHLLQENPEAAFWRGTILSRLNRGREADTVLARAYLLRPQLEQLFETQVRTGA